MGLPGFDTNNLLGGEGMINGAKRLSNWTNQNAGITVDHSAPWKIGIGGQRLDMSDPRMLASLAMAPAVGPGMAAAGVAYAAGRQIDNNRQNKRLDQQYLPRADANAKQQQQAGLYGGLSGGSANAMGQHGYEAILRLLLEQKRAVRQKQIDEEKQGMSSLMSLLPMLMGGGPAAAPAAGGTAGG